MKTLLAVLFFAGNAAAAVPYWMPPMASTHTAYGTGYLAGTLNVYPSTTTAAASPTISLAGPTGIISATSFIGSTAVLTGSEFSVDGGTFVVKNGYVGIGTNTPTKALDVYGDLDVFGNIWVWDSDHNMDIWSTGIDIYNSAYTRRIKIAEEADSFFDTGYNLGVGTIVPTYKLDVAGGGHFTSSMTVDGIYYGDGSGLTNLPGSVLLSSFTVETATDIIHWAIGCDTDTYKYCDLRADIFVSSAGTPNNLVLYIGVNGETFTSGFPQKTFYWTTGNNTNAELYTHSNIEADGDTVTVELYSSYRYLRDGVRTAGAYNPVYMLVPGAQASITSVDIYTEQIGRIDQIGVGSIFKLYGMR